MPNAGHMVLGFSAALAVAAAVGCTSVILSSPNVQVDDGTSSCMASTGSGTTVFGFYIENKGPRPVTIDSFTAGTVNGLAAVSFSALPPRSLQSTAIGVGVESYAEVADWAARRPVAGAPLPARSEVAIVIFPRLRSGVDEGNVRDFTIRVTAAGGIQHVFHSGSNVGFYLAKTPGTHSCDK